MHTTFLLQALRMDLGIFVDNAEYELPAASLGIFNIAIVLLLLPFVSRVVYPFLKKYRKEPKQTTRIGRSYN